MIEPTTDPNVYRVHFDRVGPPGPLAFIVRIVDRLRGERARVSPLTVSWALQHIMWAHRMRTDGGHALVPNHFKVFLAEDDIERARGLEVYFNRHVPTALERFAEGRRLALIDQARFDVRLDRAAEEPLSPLEALVRVGFVTEADEPPILDGEMTLRGDGPSRVSRRRKRPAADASPPASPPDGAATVRPSDVPSAAPPLDGDATVRTSHAPSAAPPLDGDATVRTSRAPSAPPPEEPVVPGAVRVGWDGGSALVLPGHRVRFGRPSDTSPPGFVPLRGASRRISSLHFWVENDRGVLVGRERGADHVKIGDTPLEQDQHMTVELPCEVDLSRGALQVRLDASG